MSDGATEETTAGARRLFMNKQSATRYEDVPLAARQQLGDIGKLRDARSGNTVDDEFGNPGQGTGGGVSEVTYHLDSTPPPAEPGDAPGSKGSGRARAVNNEGSGRNGAADGGLVRDRFGYRQANSADKKTSMRTAPNRDERILNEYGDHEAEVMDIQDGGSGGHKMMPQGVVHSTDDNPGVFQGTKSESDSASQKSNPQASNTGGARKANSTRVDDSRTPAGGAPTGNSSSGFASTDSSGAATSGTVGAGSADANPNSVPDGSVNEIMDWVGDDKSRARQALDAENKKDTPRKSLVNQLNEKLA